MRLSAHAERFEREVIPFTGYLLGHAQSLTKQRHDAEDLVQDAMLKAYASFATFRTGSNMKSWLYRILVNTWVDNYRQSQRRPDEQLSGDLTDGQISNQMELTRFASRSAELEVLVNVPGAVTAALRDLPEDLREVIYYADVQGYRNTEIAVMFGIPVGTVASRLHRGRNRLRESLLGECA
ncbi:sigma-70 family RNA polymerase sigma factor [Mycolicibacterium tokaiense]|uniref:RNA polymerase sigma factor n=1 Tax=Mycolicibacterium tokaiense TaxID=39695 RepID=A0A378TMT1_9MYCO|nr:sigma-70 family RNA polymerase sigma factor [Mycolicibacterium tokaiense]BBY84566.1 RNA polymerase sigma factor [Mycolicibacterium tokaiense]STZ60926.1 RNA polymerase sigma-E factor [Mycolicibacterium tokaiense]